MSASRTVSGNDTVSGNNSPPNNTENQENTSQTVTTADTTTIESLLSALLEEEKKTNDTLNKTYETLMLYREESLQAYEKMGLSSDLQSQVLATDIAETETAETEYRETVLTVLENVGGELKTANETLDSLNITVSGNNVLLKNTDITTKALSKAYTEQTETENQVNNYSLATGFGILFVLSVIVGCIIAKSVWGRMK